MNKAEKIKVEIERWQEETMDENRNFKSQYDQGIFDGLSLLEYYIDSLEEEPISNDLEEVVNAYIGHAPEVDECSSVYGKRQAFKAGAQWQKERMLNNAIEREVKVDAGGYPYIDVTELYDYDKDKPLAKEGDKVKLIIFMEE